MTMSAVIASTFPAASACPFTAAIVGCRRCHSFISVRAGRCFESHAAVAGMSCASCPGEISYPAEKALPAPVSISTFTSWSLCTSSSASLNSVSNPVLSAFIFSGRFSVSVAMRSDFSSLMNSYTINFDILFSIHRFHYPKHIEHHNGPCRNPQCRADRRVERQSHAKSEKKYHEG